MLQMIGVLWMAGKVLAVLKGRQVPGNADICTPKEQFYIQSLIIWEASEVLLKWVSHGQISFNVLSTLQLHFVLFEDGK